MLSLIDPWFDKNCTYAPSILTLPSARFSRYSSRRSGVKPQFLLTMIFWRPGNLYIERRSASIAVARCESRVRTLSRIWPMLTRATVPLGLPQAPRMPVCRRSAPAQDNILLIRMTWNGCTRTRRWNASLPAILVMYLLAQIRRASRASDEICSYSFDTRWQQKGKSSTGAFLRPRSKIRILGSGTPRLYRLLGFSKRTQQKHKTNKKGSIKRCFSPQTIQYPNLLIHRYITLDKKRQTPNFLISYKR